MNCEVFYLNIILKILTQNPQSGILKLAKTGPGDLILEAFGFFFVPSGKPKRGRRALSLRPIAFGCHPILITSSLPVC